jgi:hypothetical protein
VLPERLATHPFVPPEALLDDLIAAALDILGKVVKAQLH